MNNIKAAGVIFIILCAIVIYASLSTNSMISDQISTTNNDILSRTPQVEKVKKKEPVSKVQRRIQPEDPAKYGMVVMPDSSMPRTENDWETQLSAIIDKQGVFETEEGQKALSQIQEDEAAYQKNMSDLNKKIEAIKKELAEDPLNESRRVQLQNLYKLQAIGRIMNHKIKESTIEKMPTNVGPTNTDVSTRLPNKDL